MCVCRIIKVTVVCGKRSSLSPRVVSMLRFTPGIMNSGNLSLRQQLSAGVTVICVPQWCVFPEHITPGMRVSPERVSLG